MRKIFGNLKVIVTVTVIAGCLILLTFNGGMSNAQAAESLQGQDQIVGFWFVKFIAEGNTDPFIPDGTVIDSGYAQWHSDGTEINNSLRAPVTQSFCLGVWGKTGGLNYELNHFAMSWSFDNGEETYQGPANIREWVTLRQDHNSFTGKFTIKQYDPWGGELVSLTGQIEGQRITMTTPVSNVLPVVP
jgi:hypothetical protein